MHTSPKTISDIQIHRLLSHCYRTWHRAVLTLLVDTGLRVSELTGLRKSDLWLQDAPLQQLDVPAAIAKNHQPRTIPFTLLSIDAIRDLRAALWLAGPGSFSPWALPSPRSDHPMTARTIQRIVLQYGWQTLQTRVTPHTLRHTFATRLMRKTSIRIVQQLLGHKSLSSTQIYTHPNSQDLKEAISTLDVTA